MKGTTGRVGILLALTFLFIGRGEGVGASQRSEDLLIPFALGREEWIRLIELHKDIEQTYAEIDSLHLLMQKEIRATQNAHAAYVLQQGSINFVEYDERLKTLREKLDRALHESDALRLKIGLSPVSHPAFPGRGEGKRYTGAPLFAFYTPLFVREDETAGPVSVWRWAIPLMIIGIIGSAFFWRYLTRMSAFRKGTLYPMLKVVRKDGVREPLVIPATGRQGMVFL